ncbi:MAG: S49 family peptidase [candidate division Zixibacteria bacterium]|nr:S49 family peptidase [candidate division Zixibacteria bacterium]
MINNSLLSPLWAILPSYADKIYGAHDRQIEYYAAQSPESIKEKFNCNIDLNDHATVPETFTIREGVGVLPVTGMVIPKSDFFTIFFGGFAALDVLERDFNILVGREDVHTILLDIDSPGGNAFGVEQFANMIFNARDKKTILSITSGMMASAAMWIGAAAHKTYITGEVTVTGSIGTVTTHTDISELNKRIGITQTEIAAGEFKRVPSSLAPLDEKGREVLQDQVNQVNAAFVGDIAKFKNVQPRAVRKMAEGKTFIGSQAIKIGLIDGLSTMGQLFENIGNGVDMIKAVYNNNFNSLQGGQKMTLIEKIANMKAEDVDLYNAMIEKGKIEAKTSMEESLTDVKAVEHAKGIEVGKVEGIETGKAEERARIENLSALSNPACKEMVDKFIADGKTTAPEAAVEILKAQGTTNATKLANLETNSPDALNLENAETIDADGKKKGLKALVADYMAEHKCSKGTAITACAKAHPEAENDFVQIVKRKKY